MIEAKLAIVQDTGVSRERIAEYLLQTGEHRLTGDEYLERTGVIERRDGNWFLVRTEGDDLVHRCFDEFDDTIEGVRNLLARNPDQCTIRIVLTEGHIPMLPRTIRHSMKMGATEFVLDLPDGARMGYRTASQVHQIVSAHELKCSLFDRSQGSVGRFVSAF